MSETGTRYKTEHKDITRYIDTKTPFLTRSGGIGGGWETFKAGDKTERLYIVTVYSTRRPIYIYSEALDKWWGNDTSPSLKAMIVARPSHCDIEMICSKSMHEIAENGLTGAVKNILTGG